MAGFRFSSLGASVALAALALAGCNRTPSANQLLLDNQSAAAPLPTLPATLPMTDVAAPPPVAAPAATALPETRPIRTVRVRDPRRGAEYAYADAAYQFSDALGEAPPDYGFDYAGVQPWAWEGYDDSLVFAEPVPGGYRTYYYEPGEEEPYFVRDPYYSYGYDNGQLAVVYDVSGDIVPWEDYGPQVVYASRYLMRGQDLWRASRGDRVSINVQNWTNYRTNYFNQQQRWDATRVRQPMWMNYAQQDVAAQRRSIDQQRFNSWQAQGFRAAPPPRAIPAQWQQASWARDPHRFTPVAATVAGGAAIAAGAMLAHNAQVRHQQQQQLLQAQQVNATRLQHEQMAQQQQQRAFTAREQAQARNFQAGQQRELQQQAALARQQQAQAARVQQNERVAAQRQQAQATAQREQQAMRAQRDQQVRSERATMQREQQAARAQRDQQMRAERVSMQREQQQVRIERGNAQREQQAARAEQQQARVAEMAQRRQQAEAGRAQQMQAREMQRAESRPAPRPEPQRSAPHGRENQHGGR